MGCGGSSNVVHEAKQNSRVAQVRIPSPLNASARQQQQQQQQITSAPNAPIMATNEKNVLISCHATQQDIADNIRNRLSNSNKYFTFYTISDIKPQSIATRANLIRTCDVFIVLISRDYQHTLFCMETINYAKDLRKPIVSILAESNFQPFGALGAISASSAQSIMMGNEGISENILVQLSNGIGNLKTKKNLTTANVSDMDDTDNQTLNHGQKQSTILICTVNDGASVGNIIYEDFLTQKLNVAIENITDPSAACSIRMCRVFVPILSPQFEQTLNCRAAFEEARRIGKPIVPVIAVKKWKPDNWLGLGIAGSNFFRIFDRENAYKPFYDTNRIADLRVEVEVACRPIPSEAERERAEMKSLKEQIEECQGKLKSWPPPRKPRDTNMMNRRQPVRVLFNEPSAKLDFIHIHHSITRMERKAPPAMLDEYGFPKRRVIDCMISYQWDNQEFVRKVYEDMSMREIPTWFDIWGAMQGNVNEAMATGVECAKVLLVFLSKAYIESINCLMEFRYAMYRGKAFVIIRTEPNIQVEQWMIEAIQGFPQYDIYSYAALEQLINGVPTIDVIMQALRKLVETQPPDVINDCSAELFELRCLLDDARDAISIESGQTRYKTCTRCHQQFDEYTKGGCKTHRAYYLGGTILEGRWVCCRQQEQDSPGCSPCDHTDVPRIFKQDPSYGTWTWEPP